MASSPASDATNPGVIPGNVLAGKYRVERIIGQGGMGLVVEARHLELDERVALKFLLPSYAAQPDAAQRFMREARAAVKIKSEHVARVSDVGRLENGAPYMVMEFLDGRDLSAVLEASGTLSVPDAVDWVIQGCEAIAEAHGYGIVHRDLKPANLFLARRPDGTPIVKVLDFGISKVLGDTVDVLTRTSATIGSALYMSPEQMQQTKTVDHRTDIYALGITLYELLAGKQPFYADTLPQLCAEILTGTPTPLRTLRSDISEHLAWVLERAYARDRTQRFNSVAEFAIALAPHAPPRVQTTLERIARLGGLPPPVAGAPPTGGAPMPQGATPQGLPPPVLAAVPPGFADTGQGAWPGAGPRDSGHIMPGPYSAPASANAAAAFAESTKMDLSRTDRGVGRSSKVSLVVALLTIGGLLALGAFAGFRWLSPTSSQGERAAATGEAAPEATAPPPSTASATATPPTVTPTAVATEPPVASAVPTAVVTTAPLPPVVRPPGIGARPPPRPSTTPTVATPPSQPPGKISAPDQR